MRGSVAELTRAPVRVIEIGILDLLGLEPSINRSRALLAGASVAARLLETGELAERLAALELFENIERRRKDLACRPL